MSHLQLNKTLPRPGIAAVAWTDSNEVHHIRLYTQDTEGYICESAKEGGAAWKFNGQIIKAKPNTSIAAFEHNDSALLHIFYLDTNNILQEYCQSRSDSSWYPGQLNDSKIPASSVSRLAALAYDDNIYCTLFYQQPDGAIGQLNRLRNANNHPIWTNVGSYGKNPMNGTSLAALSFQSKAFGSHGVRVYYQDSYGIVTDFGVDTSASFQPDTLEIKNAPPNVSLSTFGIPGSFPIFHLFFFDKFNYVSEIGCLCGKWGGELHPGLFQAAPDSSIAAVYFPETKTLKQLAKFYMQDEKDQVVECSSNNMITWEKDGVVPTSKT